MNELNPTGRILDEAGASRGFAVAKDGYISSFVMNSAIFATATPAQTILPMIEQRIREHVKPQVDAAQRSMERAVVAELEKMGIKWQLTSYAQFSESVVKQYTEKLVAERIAALVASLLPPSNAAS